MIKKIATLVILALGVFSYAQRSSDWSVPMDSRIKELVVDPLTGIVIVESTNAIKAISPESKSILWEHDKASIDKNNVTIEPASLTVSVDPTELLTKNMDVELIPNTGLFLLTKGKGFLILNIQSGEIKFNSVDKGYNFIDRFFLPTENVLLVLVRKGANYYFVGFDTKNFEIKWEEQIDQTILRDFVNIRKTNNPYPKVDNEGHYLISFNRKLYKVNKDSGKIMWQRGERVKYFDYSPANNVVVTYNTQSLAKQLLRVYSFSFKEKGEIEFIDNNTGELKFEPFKITNFKYAEDFGDAILLVTKRRFNKYSYETGEKIWEKNPKGKNFSAINKTKKGTYIYTADDEIRHIDDNGRKIWKKPVKITDEKESETLILEETDKNNIVYITETHANIVNVATGEKQWRKDLKLKFDEKRPTLAVSDNKTNTYFIYNNEKFYSFNEQSLERPEEFAKVKIKREKQVNGMYHVDNKLVVTGTGEIVGIDKSGNEIYHHFYREPGGFGRNLVKYGAGATAVFTDVAANSTVSINNGPEQGLFMDKGSDSQQAVGQSSDALSAVSKSASKRFDASTNLEKYSFFFAKEGFGEEKVKVLVKVDRATGEEVDKIIFNNNRPKYDIDIATHGVYYANDDVIEVFE